MAAGETEKEETKEAVGAEAWDTVLGFCQLLKNLYPPVL